MKSIVARFRTMTTPKKKTRSADSSFVVVDPSSPAIARLSDMNNNIDTTNNNKKNNNLKKQLPAPGQQPRPSAIRSDRIGNPFTKEPTPLDSPSAVEAAKQLQKKQHQQQQQPYRYHHHHHHHHHHNANNAVFELHSMAARERSLVLPDARDQLSDSTTYMVHQKLPQCRLSRHVPGVLLFDDLPKLNAVKRKFVDDLFVLKVRMCTHVCSFDDAHELESLMHDFDVAVLCKHLKENNIDPSDPMAAVDGDDNDESPASSDTEVDSPPPIVAGRSAADAKSRTPSGSSEDEKMGSDTELSIAESTQIATSSSSSMSFSPPLTPVSSQRPTRSQPQQQSHRIKTTTSKQQLAKLAQQQQDNNNNNNNNKQNKQNDNEPAASTATDLLLGGPVVLARSFSSRRQLQLMASRLMASRRQLVADDEVVDEDWQERLAKHRDLKRQTLLEIFEYIVQRKPALSEETLGEVFEMIEANIFWSQPPTLAEKGKSKRQLVEGELNKPNWEHVRIVYDILMRVVVSTATEPAYIKKFVGPRFVRRLLDLFRSEDARERESVKMVVHRLYGKYLDMRPFMRAAMADVLVLYVYDDSQRLHHKNHHPTRGPQADHAGINEILEIVASIVSGFALPIKEEHKVFLRRVLLPLNTSPALSSFQGHLSFCIVQYIKKDATLAPMVLRAMLRYWPRVSSRKVLLFIEQIEAILESLVDASAIADVQAQLFMRLAECMRSSQFQIAQRAIFLLNNSTILNCVDQNRHVLVPIIFRALYRNLPLKERRESYNAAQGDEQGDGAGSGAGADESSLSLYSDAGAATTEDGKRDSGDDNDNDDDNDNESRSSQSSSPPPMPSTATEVLGHWNSDVQDLSRQVFSLFKEMDAELLTRCYQANGVGSTPLHIGGDAQREQSEQQQQWYDQFVNDQPTMEAAPTSDDNKITVQQQRGMTRRHSDEIDSI